MARRKQKPKARLAFELRLVLWIVTVLIWRLPKVLFRVLVRLLKAAGRLLSARRSEPETADSFYRSYQWRKLRVDVLEANRERYGMLACECCGMIDVTSFHVDHIYPRSTHPDLALDPDNLQVLCDDCNIGKGTGYTTNWRGGTDPRPGKRRGWRRYMVKGRGN